MCTVLTDAFGFFFCAGLFLPHSTGLSLAAVQLAYHKVAQLVRTFSMVSCKS